MAVQSAPLEQSEPLARLVCPRCGAPMVQRIVRRGTNAGRAFFGCSRYPTCRAQVHVGSARSPVPNAPIAPRPLPNRPLAGASAQATFDRRQRAFSARRRKALPLAVGLAGLVAFVAFVGLEALNVGSAPFFAVIAGALVLIDLLPMPQSIRAWRVGAGGERETGRHLAQLEAKGFVVLHDRKRPGSSGNIDHVVIGPTGVWVVETKSWRGRVKVRGGELWLNGRSTGAVDQVRRNAAAVAQLISDPRVPVRPVLVVHRAELPFFTWSVHGVPLVSGRGLTRLLTAGRSVLDAQTVGAVVDWLDGSLAAPMRGS